MKTIDVRPSALAGSWYSLQANTLEKEVDDYINHADSPLFEEEIIGLVAPHAGYRFSGPVAGYAFRTVLGNQYDTVIVVSPYHHSHYHPVLTTKHHAYSTPLGNIPIDQKNLTRLDQKLTTNLKQRLFPIVQDQEHSVEIELPFLQRALSSPFLLLPLMHASKDPAIALDLGRTLGEILQGQNSLLVASTDLSHFYPEKTANTLDKHMLDAIASFDPAIVIEAQRSGKGQACGMMAVLTVMEAARSLGAHRAHILHYATSGAASGDYNRVVGYGAGVFLK
jgi:AmmeMemoRadiSam system protein B